jgi:hypothetical protein
VTSEACVTHGTKRFATPRRASPPQASIPRSLPVDQQPEVVVSLKKVIIWLVVAFVVFYVIKYPQSSADFVKSAGEALGTAASSLASFVGSLV